MPTVPLPDEPNLEHLRNQAKRLRRDVRAGDPDALAEVASYLPPGGPPAAAFPLSAAQLVVARRHGFTSWPRLERHVEVVVRYSRFPERMSGDDTPDLADRFVRLACLNYSDDRRERWEGARNLLARHPGITGGSVFAAAADADVPALRRILAADAGSARREGGPYRWEPLFTLAYARHDPDIDGEAVLVAARLLIDAGADPDAGYLWHGSPSPFTVLTGVFGEGEQGPDRQPRHPHSLALGRLLLQAGADPNDGQTLYNRMFGTDNDHLELLFEFGLGTPRPGPWSARLGSVLDTPIDMIRDQLAWAITHGMAARTRLLVDHGVDLTEVIRDDLTATELAATTGHPELIEHLVANGAPRPELSRSRQFVAAVLVADRDAVEQLRHDHPHLVDRVRAARPGLVAWAAVSGRPGAVELLVELGFDVNAKGRTDVPDNAPWQTALHGAVEQGDVDLARRLLRLGADPDSKDMRFDGTPLDWARHFGHGALIELLEPMTTADNVGP